MDDGEELSLLSVGIRVSSLKGGRGRLHCETGARS